MNIAPILRSLREDDFAKVLTACKNLRESFPYILARKDDQAEFHIDIPGDEQKPMDEWLNEEDNFE